MPRLTKDQWSAARIKWESDPAMTDHGLAAILGVSKQAVEQQRKKNKWQKAGALQNVNERAQFAADNLAKLGLDKQKADSVNAAVEIRAKLLEQHREDWKEHREQFTLPDIAANFELGKSAKITAEMLKIRQEGERKAYGLDEQQTQESKSAEPMQIVIKRATKKDD